MKFSILFQACVQRLRKNRTKLVEQLRGAETLGSPSREEKSKKFIDELMREELDELKNIQDRPNTLCTCCTRGVMYLKQTPPSK